MGNSDKLLKDILVKENKTNVYKNVGRSQYW